MNAVPTGSSDRSARRIAHITRSILCTCGQELDVCHQAHCPRCGRTLRR